MDDFSCSTDKGYRQTHSAVNTFLPLSNITKNIFEFALFINVFDRMASLNMSTVYKILNLFELHQNLHVLLMFTCNDLFFNEIISVF